MAVFWGFATDIESCLSPYSVVMPRRAVALGSRPQWLPDGGTVSALSLVLLLAVFAFDAVTPSRLVLGILLTAPVALSGLDGTRQITRLMVPLALLANVVAAWLNAQVDGWSLYDLANRVLSMLSAVLVGVLTLRFQEARVRAALLDVQQHRARHERALRELLQAVSGPYDQAAFLQRAAQALLEYSGAASVVLGAVSKAMLRHPYSTARNETALDAGLLRPGQRLSTLFLASSAGSRQVWAVQDGEILLTRLPRPGDDDILMILSRPQVSVDEVEQAIVVLGPMLEHTGLPEAVREDQVRLARHTHLIRDLVYAFSHDLRTPLMANALTIRNALKGAYGPLPEDYRDT